MASSHFCESAKWTARCEGPTVPQVDGRRAPELGREVDMEPSSLCHTSLQLRNKAWSDEGAGSTIIRVGGEVR